MRTKGPLPTTAGCRNNRPLPDAVDLRSAIFAADPGMALTPWKLSDAARDLQTPPIQPAGSYRSRRIPETTCRHCRLLGPHADRGECIDAFRSGLAIAQFRRRATGGLRVGAGEFVTA